MGTLFKTEWIEKFNIEDLHGRVGKMIVVCDKGGDGNDKTMLSFLSDWKIYVIGEYSTDIGESDGKI